MPKSPGLVLGGRNIRRGFIYDRLDTSLWGSQGAELPGLSPVVFQFCFFNVSPSSVPYSYTSCSYLIAITCFYLFILDMTSDKENLSKVTKLNDLNYHEWKNDIKMIEGFLENPTK